MELHDQSPAPEKEVTTAVEATQASEAPKTESAEPAAEVAVEDLESEAIAEEAEEQAHQADEDPAVVLTKDAIIERLRNLAENDAADITAEELGRIKQQFYQLKTEEQRAARESFIAEGGDPEAFEPVLDPLEETFKQLFTVVKEKKAELRARQDAEREANLKVKREIIAELSAMSTDADNVNRHYARAKELQAQFLTVGEVPPTEASNVWKEYQEARERFYDQLKVNKELRDYDFKKNLAQKQLLCEQAELLNGETDVIVAFRRLQDLHDKWREIGPVSKELREELWTRFKDASALVNKRYQAYFEERKARELANEQAKEALCERVEALDFEPIKTYADWDNMTKIIMEAQADWKKIGFASRKANNALFTRFRAVCDRFFTLKSDFFKQMKETQADNLARKTALAERAEALKDSTDWRKTTDELVALQKEWRTIGAVPKKQSDAVWRRFMDACDAFFDAKKAATGSQRSAEQANLQAKQAIIDELRVIMGDNYDGDTSRNTLTDKLAELRGRWQEIGHVPFKLKDVIYDEFRQLLRDVEKKYDLRQTRARRAEFEANVAGMAGNPGKLNRERDRLVRALEAKRADLATYSNNLGFLSFKSKGGESMLREMERRMERLRDEIKSLEEKIELVDKTETSTDKA